MKLTRGQISDIFQATHKLEQGEDMKFSPDVRLKFAINYNKAKPFAEELEKAILRTSAQLNYDNRKLGEKDGRSQAELQNELNETTSNLRAEEIEVDFKLFSRGDLKLDENSKIGSVIIAQLLPIIEGLEL